MSPSLLLLFAAHSLVAAPAEGQTAKSADPCRALGEIPWVHGGGGNDHIYGGGKIPYRLYGDKDRDFILGSEGGEIIGGEGGDTLVGYGGADRFVYEGSRDSMPDRKGRWSPKTGDTIVDFQRVDGDRIDLSHLPRIGAGSSDALEWSGSEPGIYSVWKKHRAGDTFVFVDVDGDARGDLVIRLLGDVPLSQSDFCGVQAPML